MQDEYHEAAVIACRTVLKPVINLLLRNGLSFKEFCNVARTVFVELASENNEGRKNVSDIAIKTGISRKGVKRALIGQESTKPRLKSKGLYYLKVLEVWHTNKRFLDEENNPLKLPYIDNEAVSLIELMQKLSIDVPASTILKDLIASGVVDIDEKGRYFPKDRSAIRHAYDPGTLIHSSVFLAAHAETVLRNISTDRKPKLFERQTFTFQIQEDRFKEFEITASEMCRRYLSEMEDYIVSISENAANNSVRVIGMGAYLFNFSLNKQITESFIGAQKE